MKIVWVHNYTYPDYIGGAELSDYYWIKKGKELRLNLIEVTHTSKPEQGDVYILGNFGKIQQDYLQKIVNNEPYICIIHGVLVSEEALKIYNSARLLVCMSPSHKNRFSKLTENPNTSISSPYVDPWLFCDYGKTRKPNSYLYVGAIREHKGIAAIIDHARLNQSGQYHFYGPIKQKEIYLLDKIKQAKNCQYHGSISNDQVPKIMNQYEKFIWLLNPAVNDYESFGRTLAEALLCGMKLVVDKKSFGIFSWKWDLNNRENIARNITKEYEKFWGKMLTYLS